MRPSRDVPPRDRATTAVECLVDVIAALTEWGWYPAGHDPGKAPYSIMGHARTAVGVNGPVLPSQAAILLQVSDALRHAIGATVGLYMTVREWENNHCSGAEHAATLCDAARQWIITGGR